MDSNSLSCVQNKGSFFSSSELPESLDICAELVHKFGGDVSILEDLFSPASKSELIWDKSTTRSAVFLTLSASAKRVLSLSVSFPVSILTLFCCLNFFFLNALLSVTFLARFFNAISVDSFRCATFDVENSALSINKLKLVSLRF